MTDKSDILNFPAAPKNLLGRESDLFNLVQKIASNTKRLVSVVGVPGIGKSSLVRRAIHFFDNRKLFTGGIVLIQAKGVESTENLKKLIICSIISEISDEKIKQSIRETAITHPEALINNVIDYLKSKEKILPSKGGIYGSRSRPFLLVFDNVEGLMKKEQKQFRKLLSVLLDQC